MLRLSIRHFNQLAQSYYAQYTPLIPLPP